MGKAGRRKKNRQRRKQRTGADPLLRSTDDDDASASANAVVNNNPHSALLKLRHADPKTRHAALVALQASVLDRIGCDDPRRRRISMKVLQAVREQVVSNDLECSAVAAECLASYLSSSSSLSHDDDDTATTSGETPKEIEQRKQTTASWALVFLGRLEACRKALEERKRELELRRTDDEKNTKKTKRLSKNQRKKAAAIRKRWYAVAAPCFRALCRLIETNGPALDRIRGEGAAASFVDVVLGMLSLECRSSSSEEEEDDGDGDDDAEMGDAAAAAGEQQQQQQHDAIFAELRGTAAMYAARCLHSALDDNPDLASVLEGGDRRSIWKTLLGSTTTDGATDGATAGGGHRLSVTTRLHLMGCLVNVYQMSWLNGGDGDGDGTPQWHEGLILEYGILGGSSSTSTSANEGLLFEVLRSSSSSPSLLPLLVEHEARYREARALFEKQATDRRLEDEVVTEVRERKEPAKLIARRQKQAREARKRAHRERQKAEMIAAAEAAADAGGDDDDDASMEVEPVVVDDELESTAAMTGRILRERDGEEATGEALAGFTSVTGPAQLGLEILTNLAATWIGTPEEDDDDDAMSGHASSDDALSRTLRTDAASRLSETLRALWEFLRTRDGLVVLEDGKAVADSVNDGGNDPIRSEAEETVGKVSACVVNCLLSGAIADEGWARLRDTAIGILRAEAKREEDDDGGGAAATVLDACASVLAVAEEVRPGSTSTSEDGGGWIDLCRGLLPRADAVFLLSAAIRTAAPAAAAATEEVVRSLTESFLAILLPRRPPPPTANAIDDENDDIDHDRSRIAVLRTFMDWYGNDDFHPRLYETLKVSEGIASCLADLAAASKKNNRGGSGGGGYDEEQLRILRDSERFLEYKQRLRAAGGR